MAPTSMMLFVKHTIATSAAFDEHTGSSTVAKGEASRRHKSMATEVRDARGRAVARFGAGETLSLSVGEWLSIAGIDTLDERIADGSVSPDAVRVHPRDIHPPPTAPPRGRARCSDALRCRGRRSSL